MSYSLRSVSVAAVVTVAGSCSVLAQDSNLGVLAAGNTPFSGTTVGQPNRIDTYAPLGNSAAIWDQDYIYQFTTTQTYRIGVTTNDPDTNPDNDFWLLNSLATTINANGLRQANVVQDATVFVSGVFGIFPAGTYYLAIDAWRGNPATAGTPAQGRAGAFAGNLNLTAITTPTASSVVLGGSLSGTVASGQILWYTFNYAGGAPFTIDTNGSSFDTEIALFNSVGALIGSDDDSGAGVASLLTSPNGLPAGQYYLAASGFNSAFSAGFGATAGTAAGSLIVNGLSIPTPAGITLLGVAGLVTARRRRA